MTNKLEDFGQIIRRTVAGSNSYGTNRKPLLDEHGNEIPGSGSDYDERGIFIPHRKFLVGLHKVDVFQSKEIDDIEYFSLQKFVSLALEGNPNVVEQLFVDRQHVLFEHKLGKELYDLRYEFLTKNAYGRFGSYAFAQIKRLNSKNNGSHHGSHKDIIDEYGYDTKHAMHLVRLFQMGIQILTHRELYTFRPNRDELLAIRYGKYTLDEILEYAEELNKQLEEAMMNSKIPDYPDFNKINRWVIDATDRIHHLKRKWYQVWKQKDAGMFKGNTFNVLPLEYEMVDKSALVVVSNRLVRNKNKSEAMGVVIPYKDWFTGLREFSEFKFEDTRIDSIYKFVNKVRSCDPKAIDLLFAADKHVIFEHALAKEFKDKMKTLFTTKASYHKTKNYVMGNLKGMLYWEQLKKEWEDKKSVAITKMTEFPPVPKKTLPENSSMMTKYGYDTLTAYDIVHVLKIMTELMNTGTIIDSRSYEPELYAIKHGKYKTFEEYHSYVKELLVDFENANNVSKLQNHNFEEVEQWLIEYIVKFHSQLK